MTGAVTAEALSNGSMLRVLDRMGRGALTSVHGFRATFKTWASERTSFQNEIVEAGLRTSSAARSSKPIGVATCLRSGVGLCSNGRRSA